MRTRVAVPFVLALSMCSKVDTTPDPIQDDPVVKPGDDLPDHGDPVDDPTVTDPALALAGTRSASGGIVAAPGGLTMFYADSDNGDLVAVSRTGGAERRLALGGEPTRVVRVGPSILVTLRAAGEVVRVDIDDDGEMAVVARRAVGAEPFDIVAARDQSMVFVSLSQEDAIVALDGADLSELGRWTAPGEPKWLTLGADGDTVFAAMTRRPLVLELHPSTGDQTWHPLPTVKRFQSARCPDRDLLMRTTGDMTMTPDGDLLVPALYADTELVDNRDPSDPNGPQDTDIPDDTDFGIDDSGGDNDTGMGVPHCPEQDPPRGGGGGAYGRPADPIAPGNAGRFTPVMLRFHFGTGDGEAEPITLGTSLGSSPFNPAGNLNAGVIVRSYPSSIVVGHTNHADNVAFITMPSSSALVAVDLDRPVQEDAGGFATYARVAAAAPFGVSTLAKVPNNDGRLIGWSLIERQSVEITVNDISAGLFDPSLVGYAFDVTFPAAPSVLPEAVQRGRRLFYASDLPSMAQPSSGVSCETCHADGRNDGFTWLFEDFPRNTPNLAGVVSQTLPITWTGEVATIVDEVHATNTTRMNGTGVTDAEANDIAAYVDFTRAIVRPQPTTTEAQAAVDRGEALFRRADVGCATCHGGAAFADGNEWQVVGFRRETNTPSLRGIGGSAPYFHDGSALTLRAVLDRARDGSMGNTGALSDAELDDLEAYLRTL
ncbi:MAG: c-type cytochrome [Alphaproteobacteria bacterium]|nr:c-type cytochrome [Alphaproteobacteria bacterium]